MVPKVPMSWSSAQGESVKVAARLRTDSHSAQEAQGLMVPVELSNEQ